MLDPSIVFELFVSVVTESLTSRRDILIVEGGIGDEDEFPIVSILAGENSKTDLSRELYQNDFTVYVDIYFRDSEKQYFSEIVAISKLIEQGFATTSAFSIDGVFKVENKGQLEPDRSAEGVEYSSRTRLEWQIEYHTER